jgi:hypothetical protein
MEAEALKAIREEHFGVLQSRAQQGRVRKNFGSKQYLEVLGGRDPPVVVFCFYFPK